MRVLGFDTATSACSAALWQDGDIIARRFEAMAKGHAEHLMGMIEAVMDEAAVGYPDLDLVAVTTGPGGFTGMRIGLAAARGLALAADVACLGVSTLAAVAHGIGKAERENTGQENGTVLVAIESKRADVYVQAFDAGLEPLGDAGAVLPEDLAEGLADGSLADGSLAENLSPVLKEKSGRVLVAGDGAERAMEGLKAAGIQAVLSHAAPMPDAAVVAALAARQWTPGTIPDRPRPLYLRPPDAKAPKDGGRLRP